MACTLWFHFISTDDDIHPRQNYDWLIRFNSREEALLKAREIYTISHGNLLSIMDSVTGLGPKDLSAHIANSKFPEEVGRLLHKRTSLYEGYRYWHEDVLTPLTCTWDPVGNNDEVLKGIDFPDDDDACFILSSIRSESVCFDIHLGDGLFVPHFHYYDKIAYVTADDAVKMMMAFPDAAGTPEVHYSLAKDTYVQREEPYNFTRPTPTVEELNAELDKYMIQGMV